MQSTSANNKHTTVIPARPLSSFLRPLSSFLRALPSFLRPLPSFLRRQEPKNQFAIVTTVDEVKTLSGSIGFRCDHYQPKQNGFLGSCLRRNDGSGRRNDGSGRRNDNVGFLRALLLSLVIFASTIMLATTANAQEKDASAPDASVHPRVPGPQFVLPENTEQKCVHDADPTTIGKCDRDTAFMRRNHMDLLEHKRDITMYKGVRTKENSLQSCINCHVTKDDADKAIKVSDPKHFCAACHEYVAVKLDCFECHRSIPDTPDSTAGIPKIPAHGNLLAKSSNEATMLGSFLKGVAQ